MLVTVLYHIWLTLTKKISSDAFKDYDPQVEIMPRISFSFPISDEALFFLHIMIFLHNVQPLL